MTQYTFELIIRVGIAIVLMIVLGNGCVVWFNHMPADWFSDYPEDGSETKVLPDKLIKSIESGRQRIPSTPWKVVFASFFGVSGVYLAVTGSVRFELAALIILAVILEMAIADMLYQIVPDQLQFLLVLSALGMIGYFDSWWEPVAGAVTGALLALAVYGLGRILYKKETIGGADIKFYITIGFVTGRVGAAAIFIMTTVFNAIYALYVRAVLKKEQERVPMLPSAWLATAVYLLFLWSRLGVIEL